MAIKPKGNKVTGTKKKDKITWVSSKEWKKALTVNAGAGNDVINFKKSKYKNKLNGQAGNDTVYGGTKNDTIHGNAGNDKLYGYNGADKIYGDAGSDKIYGGAGNDKIYAGKGNDYIDGGDGNDVIYAQYGTNSIIGGKGNDTIYGGTSADRIIYAKNTGNDIVYNATNKDTLVFRNINISEGYYLGRKGNDLVIFQGKNNFNGSVTLKNYFTQSSSTRLKKIYFEKNKQTVTIPTDLSTVKNVIVAGGNVKGTNGSEEILITKGNSTIHTSGGNDTINLNNTGHNLFTDDSSEDTMFSTTLNGLSGTDTISVNNIEDIVLYDELQLDIDAYGNKYIYIPDYMDREEVLDTKITLTSSDPDYTAPLRTFLSDMGYELVSGNATIDYWVQNVIATGGASTITGADHGAGATIRTGNKNDVINISTGTNTVYANGGDDIINVTGGVNNWIAAGQGHDTINISGGKNNIALAGENEVNITGGYNFVYGEDTDETISAIGGMNEIHGAGGDDNIIGNPNGGTTFVYNADDGNDTISIGHGYNINADVIKFSENNLNQLFLSFDGVDGMLQYDNYLIRVKDFLASDDVTDINNVNIWVEDQNGERSRLTDLYTHNVSEYGYGTDYSDYINCTGVYTLSGGLGDDTMVINESNTIIYGGEGKNEYVFNQAYGLSSTNPSETFIFSTSGQDTLYFNNYSNFEVTGNNSDVIIKYTSTSNRYTNVILNNWFKNPVDIKCKTSGGGDLSIIDFVNTMGLSNVTAGTNGNDTLTNASGLIIAGNGNDSITASNVNSTIFGGFGNDTLRGGSGDDYIYSCNASKIENGKHGNFNQNQLFGGSGNDWLYAYGENAYLAGEAGNDHYSVMLSNNIYIEDSQGTNVLHIEKSDSLFAEERAYIALNVASNGQLANATTSYFVLNKSSYDYWLTCGNFSNVSDNVGGVTVCCSNTNLNPSYCTQPLYQILDSSNRFIDNNKIYALAQEVAGWLSETGYSNVEEVFKTGTTQQKTDLITIFNTFNDTQWTTAMG